MLRSEDIKIISGRAEGGDFLQILHIPTGISRCKMPPLGSGKQFHYIRNQFLKEIEDELIEKGLTKYIIEKYS